MIQYQTQESGTTLIIYRLVTEQKIRMIFGNYKLDSQMGWIQYGNNSHILPKSFKDENEVRKWIIQRNLS